MAAQGDDTQTSPLRMILHYGEADGTGPEWCWDGLAVGAHHDIMDAAWGGGGDPLLAPPEYNHLYVSAAGPYDVEISW